MSCEVTPFLFNDLQDLREEEVRGLSPGLCYLENVCQMLEEFARQQAHKQEVQKEIYAPRECQEMELNQVIMFNYHIFAKQLWSWQLPHRVGQINLARTCQVRYCVVARGLM